MTSSSPHFPALASSLPPEIVDHILRFRFRARCVSNDDDEKKECGSLALVCRSWTPHVQRHLFHSIKIEKVDQFEGFADLFAESPALGSYVRVLKVNIEDGKDGYGTIQGFNRVLKALASLRELDLQVNSKAAWSSLHLDFSQLIPLPNLSVLSINRTTHDPPLLDQRRILSKTPNITSLTLSNNSTASMIFPSASSFLNFTPVNLPNLTHLSLRSVQFCRIFVKLNLLTESTLQQITSLTLNRKGPTVSSPLRNNASTMNLLEIIGKNLWTLEIGKEGCGVDANKVLGACPNLRKLIVDGAPFPDLRLPGEVEEIVYKGCGWDSCGWMKTSRREEIRASGKSGKDDWDSVKKVEIIDAKPSEKVLEWFSGRGVEVIVGGSSILLSG